METSGARGRGHGLDLHETEAARTATFFGRALFFCDAHRQMMRVMIIIAVVLLVGLLSIRMIKPALATQLIPTLEQSACEGTDCYLGDSARDVLEFT